jgi:hypothetical protein
MLSGSAQEDFDPNGLLASQGHPCCVAILDHVGFTELKIVSRDPHPFVIRARSPNPAQGISPNQTQSPWC